MELNDPSNLNPIESLKQLNVDEKKKLINDWENKPSVKEKEIGAYDKKTEEKIGKTKLGLLKILAIISTLALIIIAGTIGYSFYSNYKTNGEWSLIPQAVCAPNISVEYPTIPKCPDIPACPKAPDCHLSCGNYNITTPTPIVNIYNHS